MIHINVICVIIKSFECFNLKIFYNFSTSDYKNGIGLNDMMREFLVEQENFFATKAKKKFNNTPV